MEIKKISIHGVWGLTRKTIFLKGNSIIMAKNNSGKTRILEILYAALKGTLKKTLKGKTQEESKISIEYESGGNNLLAIYNGINLDLKNETQDIAEVARNPIYIKSENLDINNYVTDLIQSEISHTEEYENFKTKVEEIARGKYEFLNNSVLINGVRPSITNMAQEKMPKYKVELYNNGISINDEGDGVKKAMILKLLKNTDTNVILIDEIENHLSVASINDIFRNIDNECLLIASSHRIEISEIFDSITTIDNQTIHNIGAYINSSMRRDIIVVEGKNDLPIVKKYLELRSVDKIIVVGTNKDEAKRISKSYSVPAIIDSDGESPSGHELVHTTSRRQMENYITQEFIDNDEKLIGINISEDKTIEEMIAESEGFLEEQKARIKDYIASKCDEWLTIDNPLVQELDTFFENIERNE